MDFSNYLFRSSSKGKLMTGLSSIQGGVLVLNPLLKKGEETTLAACDKKDIDGKPYTSTQAKDIDAIREIVKLGYREMPKTCRTELQKIWNSEVFGRRKHISASMMEKGTIQEEVGITLYQDVTGEFVMKNDKRFTDDFSTGEPDIITEKIIDIKCSWEFDSFPLHEVEVPSVDYCWQLQDYMKLTGRTEATLAYCLVDTPHKLVDDKLRKLDWQHDVFDGNGDVRDDKIDLVKECINQSIYTAKGLEEYCDHNPNIMLKWFEDFIEIHKNNRLQLFHMSADQSLIEAMHSQTIRAREYLNELTINISNKIN